MYRFGKSANVIMEKVRKRNNMLSALAGSTWGKDKELLATTYKATGRAVMNYAAPLWSPGMAESQWLKLQRCQNAALRNAKRCLKMTMQDDLHRESKVMPVKQHCQLLSKQYLLMSYVSTRRKRDEKNFSHGALGGSNWCNRTWAPKVDETRQPYSPHKKRTTDDPSRKSQQTAQWHPSSDCRWRTKYCARNEDKIGTTQSGLLKNAKLVPKSPRPKCERWVSRLQGKPARHSTSFQLQEETNESRRNSPVDRSGRCCSVPRNLEANAFSLGYNNNNNNQR